MSILGFLRKCGTYLRSVPVIRKFEKYPKTSGCVTLLVLSPLVHHYLKRRSTKQLEAPILARIEQGSKPTPIPSSFMYVDRPVEEKRIAGLIRGEQKERVQDKGDAAEHESDTPYFSVILGPSGTGKTLLTRNVCMKYPVGVVYHEVFDPTSVAKGLAESFGMITKPNSIVDLALSSISDTYHHYHTIPTNPYTAIAYVMDKIAAQAIIFKKKYGYSPCLVIDGVDMIAKEDTKAFVFLIDRAKYLANDKVLHIVLVSSESNVVPLIDSTSSKTRITCVEEVMDISEKNAKAFLMAKMTEDIAQEVVNITGGRIVHLIQAVTIYMQEKDRIDRHCLPDVIEKGLMSRCTQSLKAIMKQETCDTELKVIKHLAAQGITSQVGGADIPSLVAVSGMPKKDDVMKAVDHLVYLSIFFVIR